MDSEQQEATPQTKDSNCDSMDTHVMDTDVKMSTQEIGECDENAEENISLKKKEPEKDEGKEETNENKRRKQEKVEGEEEKEEKMSEGENDTKEQTNENIKRKQTESEVAKEKQEEDNLKDDKEEEKMSEDENDDTKEQTNENKKRKQTESEVAKEKQEEDHLKDDKEEEEKMSEDENDDTKEQTNENKKRKQTESEVAKEKQEEDNLKDDKEEEEKMLEDENDDTKEQTNENKKRKQTESEVAKEKQEEDNLKDDKEEEEKMSEDENDDTKEQTSENKKRKQTEDEDRKEEEEDTNLKDDEDLSEEEKFEEIKFPDTLEGFDYKFNSDGQLRDVETDEPFQFVMKPDNHYYNQKRYEALGEILNNHVYDLLESECNLKRIPVPLDTDKDAVEGEPKSFVFASENALTTTGKLMVLIHGSGVVRAGQWARRLIINDCLDSGTQIPYIKRAKEEGYEVLVLNTNENEGKDGKDIRGSETPVKHAIYVFEHLLKQTATPARHIAIVAHSYGGCVVLSLIEKSLLDKSVFAIAFTDSVHQLQYQLNSPLQQSWLIQRSRNWVSCDKELDVKLPFLSYRKDVERYSAGTTKHEETSWKAMESIFEYFKNKEPKQLQKKKPVATQNVETKEVNTKEEKNEEQIPERKNSEEKK